MTVRKRGKRYALASKGGKTLGTHGSKAGARRQERAIKASQRRRGAKRK